MPGTVLTVLLVASALVVGWLIGRTGIGSVADPVSLTEAERRFADRMRDVVLVGSFTVDGDASAPPVPERYEIRRVEKVADDRWRFHAVMNCCGIRGALPVTVPMRWVGDTPMIVMTDTRIPGVGSFTVRLFFHDDRYSGTWKRGDTGGHMSGRLEALGSARSPAAAPESAKREMPAGDCPQALDVAPLGLNQYPSSQ